MHFNIVSVQMGYACATNIQRGNAACSNRLRVPRHIVEEKLLAAIEQDLFTDESVEIFVKEVEQILKQKKNVAQPDRDALRRQLESAERTITNIMSAIKAGIITPSTKAELEKAEAAHQRVEVSLKAEAAPTPSALLTFMPRAIEIYRELGQNLREALHWDVLEARQLLKAHIWASQAEAKSERLFRGAFAAERRGAVGVGEW